MLIYEFTGWHGFPSKCGLQVYRRPNRRYVVVVTDTGVGTSVTNAAEIIATKVCREKGISPHRLTWVEHYHERGTKLNPLPPTWDLVDFDFDWRRCVFTGAEWTAFNEEGLRSLIEDAAVVTQ